MKQENIPNIKIAPLTVRKAVKKSPMGFKKSFRKSRTHLTVEIVGSETTSPYKTGPVARTSPMTAKHNFGYEQTIANLAPKVSPGRFKR